MTCPHGERGRCDSCDFPREEDRLRHATIDVRPDYGKDDEGLLPGHYAEGRGHIAGPATTPDAATKVLLEHLHVEGYVMPDETPDVHTWEVPRRVTLATLTEAHVRALLDIETCDDEALTAAINDELAKCNWIRWPARLTADGEQLLDEARRVAEGMSGPLARALAKVALADGRIIDPAKLRRLQEQGLIVCEPDRRWTPLGRLCLTLRERARLQDESQEVS